MSLPLRNDFAIALLARPGFRVEAIQSATTNYTTDFQATTQQRYLAYNISISTIFISMLACLVLVQLAISTIFDPLRTVPGPILARFSYLFEFWHATVRNDWGGTLQNLHKRYGPVVRIGPNEVHVMDPAWTIKHFSRRDLVKCSTYYAPLRGAIGGNLDPHQAARHRAVLRPCFSGQNLAAFSASKLNGILDSVCARVEDKCGDNGVMNASHLFWAAANDMIATYLFGVDAGFLGQSLEEVHKTRAFGSLRFLPTLKMWPFAWAYEMWPRFMRSLSPAAHVQKMVETMIEPILKTNPSAKPSDGFDHVASRLRQYGHEYSSDKKMVVENFDFMISVGEGLTTNLIRMVHHLMANPECARKLRMELDGADLQDGWRDPKLLSLEYLNACVRETVRLNLPTYVRVSRKCPEPVMYGDIVIPAMTSISMTVRDINRDPSVYVNPDAFVPERYLGNSAEAQSARAQWGYAFGPGNRSCLGRDFGSHILTKATACLVSNFDFSFVHPEDVAEESAGHLQLFVEKSRKCLEVNVRRRGASEKTY